MVFQGRGAALPSECQRASCYAAARSARVSEGDQYCKWNRCLERMHLSFAVREDRAFRSVDGARFEWSLVTTCM